MRLVGKLESRDCQIARLENLLVEAARSASTRPASTKEGERPARTRDAELGKKKKGNRFVL